MLEVARTGEMITVDNAIEVSGVATEALPESVKTDSEALLAVVAGTAVDGDKAGLEAGEETTEALDTERPAALLELGAGLETGVKPVRD